MSDPLASGDQVLDGFEQLRHTRRRPCSYGVLCHTREMDFRATVVDLSLEGMRLESANRLKPGTQVTLRLSGGKAAALEAVRTVVRWCRRKTGSEEILLGLQYDESGPDLARSWVKPLLQEAGFDAATIVDRRRYKRIPAHLRATVEEGTVRIDGTILNLGGGGALFEAERFVDAETAVVLEIGPHGNLPLLTCRGQIRRIAPRGSRHLCAVVFKPAPPDLLFKYLRQLTIR